MKKINWSIRLRTKTFWLTLIPLFVLLTQQIGLNWVPDNWEATFGTVLSILTVIGVINDPTTTGLSDSERAMGYDELG